jgi:CRISPR/Cas system-associated protein Csm6
MWHFVQGEVEDITKETVTGRPKVCDVTEEQLQGLMRSDPASVSTELDSLFAGQKKMLALWLVKK